MKPLLTLINILTQISGENPSSKTTPSLLTPNSSVKSEKERPENSKAAEEEEEIEIEAIEEREDVEDSVEEEVKAEEKAEVKAEEVIDPEENPEVMPQQQLLPLPPLKELLEIIIKFIDICFEFSTVDKKEHNCSTAVLC